VKLGIIGYPLSHTISPAMQTAALEAAGISATYRVIETAPAFVRARLSEVRREFRGINVTIPHKEAVIPFLDELSSEAEAIGAVNTIVNQEGRLMGYNTDAPGFIQGLEEAGIEYKGRKVLVLGAGGAARAVAYGLKQAGAQVAVSNRTPERAKELSEAIGVGTVTGALLTAALKTCDLLINTTSVGLKDRQSSPLPEGVLPRHAAVVDIVYNPVETKLLRDAKQAGLKTLGGLPMLIWQGALAFELWTGIKPDLPVMYAAAERQLKVDS
jgi:shikimate dehydrogenase